MLEQFISPIFILKNSQQRERERERERERDRERERWELKYREEQKDGE